MGFRNTLSLLLPLLQTLRHNQHATFITLFINAVKEAGKIGYRREEMPGVDFFTSYLPFPQLSLHIMKVADMLRIHDTGTLALDVYKRFKKYNVIFLLAKLKLTAHQIYAIP